MSSTRGGGDSRLRSSVHQRRRHGLEAPTDLAALVDLGPVMLDPVVEVEQRLALPERLGGLSASRLTTGHALAVTAAPQRPVRRRSRFGESLGAASLAAIDIGVVLAGIDVVGGGE